MIFIMSKAVEYLSAMAAANTPGDVQTGVFEILKSSPAFQIFSKCVRMIISVR